MKRLYKFLNNLSVRWKFVFAYSLILGVEIIIAGVYLYRQQSLSAIKQAELVMTDNLMQTKASILQREKIVENTASIITLNKDLQSFLDYDYDNDIYKIEDYQFDYSPTMENILSANNTINAIRIYMKDGIVTEKLNSFSSISKGNNRDLYDFMMINMSKQYGWTSIHYESNNYDQNKYAFSYMSPISSVNSYRKSGYLELEVKEEVIFDALDSSVLKNLGKVFIVDKAGKIVSNNVKELFNKNITAAGVENFSNNLNIKDVKKINGVNSIIISIPMPQMNLSIVGIFPVSSFNAQAKSSSINVIVFLIIVAAILAFAIYFTTIFLLKRVKILVKAIKQVNDGNLQVSVDIKSKDEFGELGMSFNNMTARIHNLIETVYKSKIMEKESELKALEAHINPHFLYNTLSAISWTARKEEYRQVIDITNSLARLYRLVLSNGKTLIEVKEELDIVKSYLYIQKIRFGDRFDVTYKVDESIYEYKIIKNILQPIVENALDHGIDPKLQHGTIVVQAGKYDKGIFFKIIDDGVGMGREVLKEVLFSNITKTNGNGYAIKNIKDRLKAYYGDESAFEVYTRKGIGTSVLIKIPYNF